jgi:predicted nucleotidyltransferase
LYNITYMREHIIYVEKRYNVADMDEMLKKAQAGESVVGRKKVWSLAFADDLVIVAKSEREMKEMMKSLGEYARKKKLEVNVEKMKMDGVPQQKEDE